MDDSEAKIIGSISSLAMTLGLAFGLGLGALREQSLLDRVNKEYVLKKQAMSMEPIDKDQIPDLVIGNRILLANQTNEGTVYRPLTSSDIYRIR